MTLELADWLIIVAFVATTLIVGVVFSRRAGSSLSEYFVSGRSLPWWLAGTSMVATTFAADTPLAVTSLVAKHGLAGNWFWWAFAFGGMVTVFVYARLWRRADVMTDVELIEMRYRGDPAAALRGVRAVYYALLINPIIIGWVTAAMLTVLNQTVFFSESSEVAGGAHQDWWVLLGLLLVVGVYCTLSGLWGVVITDFIQFFVAMAGCILLAVVAVRYVGGIDGLQDRLARAFPDGDQAFRFLPDFRGDQAWLPVHSFLIMLGIQWWATWYPGAEPGGGGYVVQRMASCRDERHSLLATLWFQIAHYCLRPWPWLLVAFAALALHPELREAENPGIGFPMLIRELAPTGLRGLMLVTFLAAFMSTISTQMNWGASYLVRDVYQRFLRPQASQRELTWASRAASVLVLVAGGIAAWAMRDTPVDKAWKMLAALGAGTGAVFMLRWFWWRINAWTEISAMVASLGFFLAIDYWNSLAGDPWDDTEVMAVVALFTIPTWLLVTWLTKPEPRDHLVTFYRKVRPGGIGWRPVAAAAPDVVADAHLPSSCLAACVATALVYSVLWTTGQFLLGHYSQGLAGLLICLGCASAVAWLIRRIGLKNLV